jgi:formylmethanofuran dehydrogenase subunit C
VFRLKTITLTLKKFSSIALEFEELIPDTVYNWSKEDFENYQVPVGNTRFPLTNYFDIEVEGEAEGPEEVKMILDGDMSRVKYIGYKMTAGEIIVNGDADLQAGAEMIGGSLKINGNAESYVGREMRGGSIEVMGDVREYCGTSYIGEWRGMSGGVIKVHGNAGKQLADCMSGGEIYIGGSCDILAGIHMTKGYIEIGGDVTRWPGGQMKNGTIVIKGKLSSLLEGFENEGIFVDPDIEGRQLTGKYIKYKGDIGVNGKGSLWLNAEKNRNLL